MSDSESNDDGYVVKLRGLPWSATVDDILKFLGDIGVDKVHLTLSKEGRPSGEAFVELETEEDLMRAEEKDKKHMGSRYIEVFKVNRAEMDWVVKRSGASYDGNDDGCVRLRGLPFGCSKEEIAQFFTETKENNRKLEMDLQNLMALNDEMLTSIRALTEDNKTYMNYYKKAQKEIFLMRTSNFQQRETVDVSTQYDPTMIGVKGLQKAIDNNATPQSEPPPLITPPISMEPVQRKVLIVSDQFGYNFGSTIQDYLPIFFCRNFHKTKRSLCKCDTTFSTPYKRFYIE
ncbi:unnamed protein product [Ceutorhynchus assimilis]|uniref:RRM domain-containing protein n=1 Tax=Ceutorhynchus assimilis TaxID=467358 RepID=A0A9N9MJW0_9CUCU|nr:unnamed protein product [Ceutorhynchus assimilis]